MEKVCDEAVEPYASGSRHLCAGDPKYLRMSKKIWKFSKNGRHMVGRGRGFEGDVFT